MQDTIEVREPARPDRIVGRFPLADAAAVEKSIDRGVASVASWAADAPMRSGALTAWAEAIQRRAPEFVELLTREIGKPLRESRNEVNRAVAIVRYYAQAVWDPVAEVFPTTGQTELRVHRRPLGLVTAICPWNFPVAIPVWKIAPALAYGNCVLFKPSSSALAVAHLLAETASAALPADVLQLVATSADSSAALIDDHRVGGVSFTGSVAVGNEIVRRVAIRGAPVQAEMGGQNASIVLDDADLGFAAETIARAAMEFAGQKCTATRRVIVAETVASPFITMLVDAVRQIRIGLPEDENVDTGPLISEQARATVEEDLEGACSRGARLLIGGIRPAGDGWFIEPAVLQVDDPADRFVQEETFGPAVAVLVARSDEDAVTIANATRYGLAGAVFGTDLERAARLASQLDAGLQRVNAPTTGVDFYAPFGGDKASGYGPREQGRAAREFYTKTRTMLIRRAG